jgi:hypothetical protein
MSAPQQYIKVRPYIDSNDAKFVAVDRDNPSPTTRFIRAGCGVDQPGETQFVATKSGGEKNDGTRRDSAPQPVSDKPSPTQSASYRDSLERIGLGPGDKVDENVPESLRPSNQDFNPSRARDIFFSVKYS